MWEISNAWQLRGFLYACVLGALYCVLYDGFRAVREGRQNSFLAVFIQDTVYWLICAVTCFCFLLAVTNGEMRGYVFFGIACGFVLTRLAVSPLLFFCFCKTAQAARFIRRTLHAAAARVFRKIDAVAFGFCQKGRHFSKICAKCLKKLLKRPKRLLYTKSKS